ncbi:MAG: hypothetical protein ACREV6_19575 [Clostridium sp.]|uniref:hypothetical protein n=1 Tax=Clostridium sp. TaxID=1506 RepID=UPI003D6CEAFF
MNIYQKAFSRAATTNIKLFPLDEDDSFYKRRKLFRKAWKLKIDCSPIDDEFLEIEVQDDEIQRDCTNIHQCRGCDVCDNFGGSNENTTY